MGAGSDFKNMPFVWTEQNVIDFAYSVRHNDNFKDGIALSKGTIDELAKEFKKSKERIPLFTTEDNVKIYEGDEYVKVNDYSDYSIVTGFTAHGNHNDYKGIRFSTKEAANEYVLMNKPCLTVKEVVDLFYSSEYIESPENFDCHLKRLAKQKIK